MPLPSSPAGRGPAAGGKRAATPAGAPAVEPAPGAVDTLSSDDRPPVTADVTAVLVAHDGARWLPEALAALAAQTVPPTRVVAVDTGSTDGSADLLREALGDDAVVVLPRSTGYPDAVAAGLAHPAAAGSPDGFVWLLHDDAAPDPDCLRALLEEAERQPSAAVLGPKAVDWDDPRVLVEVGVTTDRAGTRTTGLERRERDQGQHDAVRDVLAVGTAGLLARREAWDVVGGLDPALPLFRDELDLGWRVRSTGARVVVVPTARLRHARAATTGRRTAGAVRGPAPRVDRRHALFVLLAHASRRRLLLALPGLVLGSLGRVVGLLLLRRLREARDEAAALGGVLRRPRRLRAARRRRRALRTTPASSERPVLASRTARLLGRAESFGGWLAGGGTPARSSPAALREPGGESSDDELLPAGPGLTRSVLGHPSVLVVLVLALVALLAERDLLPFGGLLAGGRLLPPPAGASDLWAAYTSSWTSTGVGTAAPSPPRVAVLAGLSTVLLGKPWLAVDVLLLASVPLAGLTAYLAARRVVRSSALRVWAAVTWALLPVATGAVAAGRLDAALVQIALPLLLLALAGTVRTDPRGRWHRVPAAGLLLAATTALAPTLWLVAASLLVLVGLAGLAGASRAQRPAAGRRALACLVVAALPVVLLAPWPLEVLRSPALLLHGPGAVALDPALVEPDLPAWRLLLLDPGGAATPPSLLTAGLLLAALAALLQADRRRPALAGWGLALAGLALAVVLARTAVAPAAGGPAVPVWPGLALQVAAAGLLLAAVVAGDGARTRLARRDFGWRQVAASVTAVAAALVPLSAGAVWVARAADAPLERGVDDVVPAFVAAELAGEPGVRALVLDARDDGAVGYELWTARGVRLGTADLPLAGGQADALDAVVADLLTARGSTAAEALATRAVRYVVLPAGARSTPAGSQVVAALDRQPGVVRRADDPALLWQLQSPAAHLAVLPPELAEQAVAGAAGPDPEAVEAAPPQALPSGRQGSTATVPAGDQDRLLVLAEAADDGWQASLDGERLEPVRAWGWAQGFELPAEGGRLRLAHDDEPRTRALLGQAAAVLLVAVLAVPGGRRRSGLEPVDAVETSPLRGAGS